MHQKIATVVLICLAAILGGCKGGMGTKELAGGFQPEQIYYTQFSLFQEKNRFRTTNYRKGILIPVNTAAALVSINEKRAELRLVKPLEPVHRKFQKRQG